MIRGKEQSKRRLDLSYIHSPQGNTDIRARRRNGLFVSDWAFGDASDKINGTSSYAFYVTPVINDVAMRAWVTTDKR